ncbi:unnamed protein product [Adineta ricciae]|uniref:Homeobox domain-containing protein n=1 Tax=Adineta ricciae TaxID=249248 RepID=A0A814NFL0_ADIRI|nr:unnamed protein product [Adineta ricciae]CAF1638295.1 unnamed protein product [Adineta ricciae]
MHSVYEYTSSDLSDLDICNTSSSHSPERFTVTTTSTPYSTYRPRNNFHSIESLAVSSVTSFSSPCQKQESTVHASKNQARKSRRKLSDWQVWYLNQIYAQNRYPSAHEQEEIAARLLLPMSSIRIWFQNHRARYGKS